MSADEGTGCPAPMTSCGAMLRNVDNTTRRVSEGVLPGPGFPVSADTAAMIGEETEAPPYTAQPCPLLSGTKSDINNTMSV
jgi:hypothetical protein